MERERIGSGLVATKRERESERERVCVCATDFDESVLCCNF